MEPQQESKKDVWLMRLAYFLATVKTLTNFLIPGSVMFAALDFAFGSTARAIEVLVLGVVLFVLRAVLGFLVFLAVQYTGDGPEWRLPE